jgi:hypothetical protein
MAGEDAQVRAFVYRHARGRLEADAIEKNQRDGGK